MTPLPRSSSAAPLDPLDVDPSYVDESWINTAVQLVPRMKSWVQTCYPGTKIGITEYSWGADNHISGAVAQADLLGIFGREGVDVATRWKAPPADSPVFKAMQMYRNYDSAKSTFGETSVSASVLNPDALSAFAALRAGDNALTVMMINKDLANSTPVNLQLQHFGSGAGTVQRWQLTNSNSIAQLGTAVVFDCATQRHGARAEHQAVCREVAAGCHHA